jgi:hypothetical protein
MGKTDPERDRQIEEQSRAARAYMQEVIDRVDARMRAREAEYERRRRFWRRLLTLGLKA